jgi:hypothetical protein
VRTRTITKKVTVAGVPVTITVGRRLGYSLRKGHQPRLVRHRDPANCPVPRGR